MVVAFVWSGRMLSCSVELKLVETDFNFGLERTTATKATVPKSRDGPAYWWTYILGMKILGHSVEVDG
jgi:hypothetical protein